MHRFPDSLTHPSGASLTRSPDRVLLSPRTGPAVAALAARQDVLASLGLVAERDASADERPVVVPSPN